MRTTYVSTAAYSSNVPRRRPALLVVPRAGHTINSEEPAALNAALAELFSAVEAGRWLAHKAA